MPDSVLALYLPDSRAHLIFRGHRFDVHRKSADTLLRWVYRAIEPRQFWWVVAMYYVGAVLFIGIFLSYH